MDVKLRKRSGRLFEPPISVSGQEFVVGSAPSCQLRLVDPTISDHHCLVVIRDEKVYLQDLDSTAGTVLNDRLILEPIEVRHGDTLRVGPEQFEFLIDDEGRGRRLKVERGGTSRSTRQVTPSPLPLETSRSKLHVIDRGEVALVRVLNNALVTDQEIGDFTGELGRLIAGGRPRLALDFGNVKHMSSQVIGEVIRASRRCAEAGGRLKLCTIQPQVAAAFAITGVQKQIDFYHDSKEALASDWPKSAADESRPAPLTKARSNRPSGASDQPVTMVDYPAPELYLAPAGSPADAKGPGAESPATEFVSDEPETLLDLVAFGEDDGLRNGTPAPAEAGPSDPPRSIEPPSRRSEPPRLRVRLRVLEGKAKGQIIEVREDKFLIGRDSGCQLRPQSHWISRIHTGIEQRGGRVFVRDLGSTNGTVVNDHRIGDEEVEVSHGDRLELGPLRFAFTISGAAVVNAPAAPLAIAGPSTLPIPALPAPESSPTPAEAPSAPEQPTPTIEPVASPQSGWGPVPPPRVAEVVQPNPLADLQFSMAVQPGLDVRLIPAADLAPPAMPPWMAMAAQSGPGWGFVEQLLQGLASASGRVMAPPAAVTVGPQQVPIPTAASTRPAVNAHSAPSQVPVPVTGRPSVVAQPAPSYAVAESRRDAETAPAAPQGLGASQAVPAVDTPRRAVAGFVTPVRSSDARPVNAVGGGVSRIDEDIEVFLKDLPYEHVIVSPPPEVPAPKPDLAAEESVAIQHELESFLESLPEVSEVSESSEDEPAAPYEVPERRESQPQPVMKRQVKEDITLDFECPACGAAGVAPVSRMGQQFFCKVCAAKFFIEGSGTVIAANHLAPVKASGELRPAKKGRADRINDRLDKALFFWQDIPQAHKLRVLAAAAVLMIMPWLVQSVFLNDPLKAQSLKAVDMVVRSNGDQLKAISIDKTEGDSLQWMNLVSPVVKEKLAEGSKIRVHVASQDAKVGMATVMVYFEGKNDAAKPAVKNNAGTDDDDSNDDGGSSVEEESGDTRMKFLVLLWKKNPSGKWLLEGNKTLQYASRLTATPSPAGRTPGRPGAPKSKQAKPAPRYYGWDAVPGNLPQLPGRFRDRGIVASGQGDRSTPTLPASIPPDRVRFVGDDPATPGLVC